MNNNKCQKYWGSSDYLPFSAALDYWCDSHNTECREAKKYAIISACERGEIDYRRTDGKDFKDPFLEMIGRNILVISRESFSAWVIQFDDGANVALQLEADCPQYPKKLMVAIEAWQAVTSDPQLLKNMTPKAALLKWLDDNVKRYPWLNNTSIEEIAKVANWKSGGPSETPNI